MAPLDDYYINLDHTIQKVVTNDKSDNFYVQSLPGPIKVYNKVATLEKNDAGLVQFPASGKGFNRYGVVDAGGTSISPAEVAGAGDHFLRPAAAAGLFGVINEISSKGISISFGDISSSNGSDPWQAGGGHHAGHGHNGTRSGLDADFRYINDDGNSFQSQTATSDSQFSGDNNTAVYSAAKLFGFTKNYQGTNGTISGVTKVGGHNDHGHLGFIPGNQKLSTISVSPATPNSNPFNPLF
ncbi:hypothetical protein [Mucilaginibacter segetis]|uniref:Uncharacterized protein n=1 Tax=Mucilaginibacter segetis TaxID=2793071 RepID=A0A934ULE6_9SPHI|nr:hypothetical protein [Mucilaginibacter segetis]MBK0378473.1 hypothetical protein [Mucilaginibacter segetis]